MRRAGIGVALCLVLSCGDDGSPSGDDGSGGTADSSPTGGSDPSAGTSAPGSSGGTTSPGTSDATSNPSDASTSPTSGESGSSSTGEEGRDYSNDRSKFFGEARCDVADVILCDSFEDAAIDESTWQIQGDATIDAEHAARGDTAVHVHTEGNAFSYLRESVTFPAPDNTYYGRMFVWIDAVPIVPDWSHWTLVGAVGSGEPGEIRVGGQFNPFAGAGMNLYGIGSDGGPTGDWTNLDDDPPGAPTAVVVQDWVCIEWLHDGANDVTRFWWDADEHPSLGTTATDHGGNQDADYVMPEFESMWVGWWLYQGGSDPDHFDVWIDEVAVDGIRIGCIL